MQKDPEKDSLLAHVLADRRYAAMLGLGFSAGVFNNGNADIFKINRPGNHITAIN